MKYNYTNDVFASDMLYSVGCEDCLRPVVIRSYNWFSSSQLYRGGAGLGSSAAVDCEVRIDCREKVYQCSVHILMYQFGDTVHMYMHRGHIQVLYVPKIITVTELFAASMMCSHFIVTYSFTVVTLNLYWMCNIVILGTQYHCTECKILY